MKRGNVIETSSSLQEQVDRLQRELNDREIALVTSNERGDFLEAQLYRLNTGLAAEIRERQTVEEKLRQLVQVISREKGDLEALVEILIDQGDYAATEGAKARVDSLTQIANRRGFDEYLLKEWHRHLRTQQPLSLVICDIDHFKLYNDCHGHLAGDDCLRMVAAAMQQCCQEIGLAARYGGEEFAIVLPETDRQTATGLARLVQSVVQKAALAHAASPVSRFVTLSFGVASFTPNAQTSTDVRALIQEADRNLYLAKHCGRNRVAS